MPNDITQAAEARASSTQILNLQHAINELVKQERFDSLPHETVGTAFLHYAARIGCQLGMNSKAFAGAAKEAFKAVAKELRG